MKEKIKQQPIPLTPASRAEALTKLAPEREGSFKLFSALSAATQDFILADITEKIKNGMNRKDALDRLEFLVGKGSDFEDITVEDSDRDINFKVMTPDDSDKTHKPQPSQEETKLKREIDDRMKDFSKYEEATREIAEKPAKKKEN
ncbi:MAG TPA: hypothetical protein VJC14_03205 [Candidatus Paceibacterota bacterium]